MFGVVIFVLDTPAKSFTIEKLVSQIRVAKAQLFVGEATVEPEEPEFSDDEDNKEEL